MSDAAPPGRVICAGRLYCDLIFTGLSHMPSLGTESFADGLVLQAGGGAFITAAYMSALGQPAALLGILPNAPFDGIVRQQIRDHHIDGSHCAPAAKGSDAQVTVAIADNADRAFLTRRVGSAIPASELEAISTQGLRHLHIGELTTLLAHPELVTWARAAGLSVSLDCGWDDCLGRSDLADIIGSVDVFLPNAGEAQKLHEAGLPAQMAPITVVKNGAAGATVYSDGKVFSATAKPVSVTETTGAGDAFNGGFLFRWLVGAPLPECLQAGVTCGALAVQGYGGVGALQSAQSQTVLSALAQGQVDPLEA